MHHTGKKRDKKRDFKKRKKRKVTNNWLHGNSNPDPQSQLELKVNASIHWTWTFKKFMNYRSRGYRLNRMTVRFSPYSLGVFSSCRGKHYHNNVLHYFHYFFIRVATHFLGLEELLHNLSPRNEEKQYGRQMHPFSF